MSMRNKLFTACDNGRLATVKFLLTSSNCDPEIRDERGNTPLHIVCQKGDRSLVGFLVQEKGCDVNCQANDGSTPLHCVCRTGRMDIVKLVANASNCDPEIRDSQGNTPLHLACKNGLTGIARFLVQEKGCDVNCQANDGSTPLHCALNNVRGTYYAIRDTIKVLLQNRCDTTLRDNHGRTTQSIPLNKDITGDLLIHMACQWGDMDIVRYLVLEQLCDVNVRNKDGDSPLHVACYCEALYIIKFFLQQRCDTRVRNKGGQSPQTIPLNKDGDLLFHVACQWGDVDIIKFLLQQRCDTRVKNERGQSPQTILLNEDGDLLLHIACQWGDMDIVRYLICEQHCEVNVQNKNGDTPLHIACNIKAIDIINFLLQQRCDTRVQNERGQNPQTIPLNEDGDLLLHMACQWGDVDIIKFLLQQRCDTRVQNERGRSPQTIPLNEDGDLLLHIACQWGNVDIVRYLVCEQHCDVNVRNKNGNSPLLIACCDKTFECIKFFIQQRCDTRVQNKKGQSPQTIPLNKGGDLLLHIACQWSYMDIVRYLVCEQHCDVNVRNKNGDTPLHFVCYSEALDIIEFLLRQRCDTRVQNKGGQSPQTIPLNEGGDLLLHIACRWWDVDIVRYLVCEQHCDVNVRKKNGDSPLHIACSYKRLECIEFLLRQRCDTMAQNKRGQSPQSIPLNEVGDLLLHIACQWGDVDSVKYLIYEQHCEVNVQNKNGDTPLHIACNNKALDIIEFLLQQRYDTRVQNERGQSPQTILLNEDGDLLLHIACQWGDMDIVRYLICEQHCEVNVQNKNGDTPLHIACNIKAIDIINFLLQQRCDTRVQNKRGQSPQIIPFNENGDLLLHMACQWGDVNIVRYLISEQHCDVDVQNKNGDSLLHVTCQGDNLDIVKYLITEQHCDMNVQNKNGDSPLHTACNNTSLHIVRLLLQQRCDTRVRNKRGQSPQTIPLNEDGDLLLHSACQWGDVDIVRYLVCEQHCEVNVQNKNGDSLLHVTCQGDNVDIVKYLITELHCDVNVRNNKGNTPLHIAIVACQPTTALHLLQHEQCNPTLPDSDGNTPLHLAYMNCTNVDRDTEMIQLARFLLSSTDLSACVNNAGQTPVELTTNYQLIQDISHITECKTKHSIQTYVKMFFVGNPSTGKSTLVKAITSEPSWWWKLLPHWSRIVKDVPRCTAGIVPITFRSKTFGNTVLYDMAGQCEYYTSHAAVIENTVLSTPPAFVVVVDLSESDDKIKERLKYWWSFIDNHAARSIVPPHVILVGSHADVIKARGVSVQEKMSTISSALQGLSSSFHFVGQVALDCRDPVSSELDQFCSLVDQSCTALRQTADIDIRCHVAYSFILERFEGRVACTLSEIATQITATDTLLPQNPDELAHLLSSVSDKGLVLFVGTSSSIEESWVILQKQELLGEFNGTIFAPENFQEHRDFARSTGVVPFSRIRQEFPQHDPAAIVGFLTYLEFCFKIDDSETIKRIEDEAPNDETSLDPSDEFYFFPALVSIDNPGQVWQPDDSMQYKCGWYYKCHPDQFLTTRFLHVLILRLVFSFALGLDKYHPSQRAPVLCRRCSVWKHGIGWLQDGIETVVEVGLQCQGVNVMMRCLKGKEVKCVQLRSAVMQEVKEARSKLCQAVTMTEFLIHPSNIQYPFIDEHVRLYSLTSIANAIAKKETHVEDQDGYNSILIRDLVIFEPYLSIGPELLNELFHPDNSDKLVSMSFLEVVDPQPVVYYQEVLEKESLLASKFLDLLQWLLRQLENPTYENFHNELDKLSIFCGRNPLDVADAKAVASVQHKKLGSSRSDPDSVQPGASGHTGRTALAETVNTANGLTAEDLDSIPEETPILKDLMNLSIPSWYSLGVQLEIPVYVLKHIQDSGAQFSDGVQRCNADMFHWWLSNDGSPTYRSLVKGLMAAGMTEAVRRVHSKYAAPPSQ